MKARAPRLTVSSARNRFASRSKTRTSIPSRSATTTSFPSGDSVAEYGPYVGTPGAPGLAPSGYLAVGSDGFVRSTTASSSDP